MDKLKPCPFCGGESELNTESAFDYGCYNYYVKCKDCEVRTGKYHLGPNRDGRKLKADIKAIRHWNKRANNG